MPASPDFSYPGLAVLAWVLCVFLVSGAGALVASIVILRGYRRSVSRYMQERSSASALPPAGPAWRAAEAADTANGAIARCDAHENLSGVLLYRASVQEPRRLAIRYATAGALFALAVGSAAYFALSQAQVNYLRAAGHPLQLALFSWIAAWPVVLVVSQVAASRRRHAAVLVTGYFALFAGLVAVMSTLPTEAPVHLGDAKLPAWAGESPLRLGMRWLAFNLAPTVLILVFRRRRLRTIAPLMLGFSTVVAAGVLGSIALAFVYQDASVRAIVQVARALDTQAGSALFIYLALVGLAAALLFASLGWLALRWIRSAYSRKSMSDQALGIEAQWLVFAVFYAGLLAYAGPAWAFAPLLAFLVARSLLAARHRTARGRRAVHAVTMLVLRVFSLGPHSEALFDALTRRWRYVGSVILIAGPDLALATLAPRQFLAFVSGRLQRLFVRSDGDLDSALAGLDRLPDADGRFRINDFFCTADTWQATLMRLLTNTEVVLMDLRNFRATHAGCVFEIRTLLQAMPLARLVFVVDSTTDRQALTQTLHAALARLPVSSPNYRASALDVPLIEFAGTSSRALQPLLRTICHAAAGGAQKLA